MRLITKFAALAAAVVFWASPGAAQTESSRQLFTQINPILEGLSDITGWKVKRKVPADYISKANLQAFIERRVKEAIKPEDVRIESLTLRMFGFLPDDFDLRQTIVELMTEQAAAFYDYDHRRLFITESDSSFLEKRAALVHELGHALADQSFPLGRYLRKGNKSDDAATAREAVIEGQATWLMWAYISKLGGGEAKISESVLDSMTDAATASVGSEYPVFEKAPLYLRESLIFPYNDGLKFTNAVVEKLGKQGFSEVFERAPVSTQQILHPEIYLSRKEPEHPQAPAPADVRHYRLTSEGSVGELDFRVLLEQYAGSKAASRIAPHWRGGEYRLYEAKRDKRPVITFAAVWDSPGMASEFFDAYKAILGKKWKKLDFREQSNGRCTGSGDRGGFVLTRDGSAVSSVEGLPEESPAR